MIQVRPRPFRYLLMTILLSFGCLILPAHLAEAAVACRSLLGSIKGVWVNKRTNKALAQAENEFQQQALFAIQEANFLGGHYYRTALQIKNRFQLDIIRDLLAKKAISETVWNGLLHVETELQWKAYYAIREKTYEHFSLHADYIKDIKTPEQLEILEELLRTNVPVGHLFWFKLNEKQIRTNFEDGGSAADIAAFTKLDGISPLVAKDLEVLMLRFSKRDNVIAHVESLVTKRALDQEGFYFISNGSSYMKAHIERTDDRLRIAVHTINIEKHGLSFGARVEGLNQKASHFIAVILLYAARQAKQFPEVREIEILAQNIVNADFVWALRKRLFHVENRKDIRNYGEHKDSGLYLRASILTSSVRKESSISKLTLDTIRKNNYSVEKFKREVENFTNVYQYWAVREIVQKRENLENTIQAVAKFENMHQMRALQILIDNNKDYAALMNEILKFNNQHQAQVLNYVASVINKNSKLIEAITQINNVYQVKAVEQLILKGKNPTLQLGRIFSIQDDGQLRTYLSEEAVSEVNSQK